MLTGSERPVPSRLAAAQEYSPAEVGPRLCTMKRRRPAAASVSCRSRWFWNMEHDKSRHILTGRHQLYGVFFCLYVGNMSNTFLYTYVHTNALFRGRGKNI